MAKERAGAREGNARPFFLVPTTSKRVLRRLSLWKIIIQSHWEKSVTNDQCPFFATSNIHARLKMPPLISPCFHDNFIERF